MSMAFTSIWLDNVVVYADLPFQDRNVIFTKLAPHAIDAANHVSAPKGRGMGVRPAEFAEADPYKDLRLRILGPERPE
jgi:hypothetical protein